MSAKLDGNTGRKIKVLIVDDERELVEVLAFRFQSTGAFSVETAQDGLSALRKVSSFKPDVVLLDLLMPVMDGWEFCRRLRENPATRRLPVIVMTAAQSGEAEERARQAGVCQVVFKPFDDHRLVQLMAQEAGRTT